MTEMGINFTDDQMNAMKSTAMNLKGSWTELATTLDFFGVTLPSNYFDLLESEIGREFIYNWIQTTEDQDTNNPNKHRPQYIEIPNLD
jgi:hypothetical protein